LDRALRFLPHVERECRNVGLVIAAGTVQEAIERLGDEKRPDFWWLKERSAEIRKIIHKEMAGRAFLYLPPEKAQFFATEKKPHVFGDAVAKAFPSAVFDISEAGACLATARPTACVFHLMRVLESGLTVLGKKFGVSLAHTNWAPAIEEIESKIREMHKDPTWKVLPDCKQQQEFYAQAATHFGILKDAWRNYTMHNRGKYTEDEAEQIFKNTKSFMAKLSERLAE
jgi:hypothetical protein